MKKWSGVKAVSVLEMLDVDKEIGLSIAEVEQRLISDGKNTYVKPEGDNITTMVLHQFKDVANVILLFAGFLSLALALREGHGYIEPIVIFGIIAMNIALAVSQERSAEKALDALQSLNSPTCMVIRDGNRLEINTEDVVVGDILVLKTGDLVAADARIVTNVDFLVDESALTGESEPVEKNANAILEKDAPIGDQINMVFSGCLVTAGNAVAVVTETGMNTQMGKIAGYLNDTQKIQTPLQKRLNNVSKMVSFIAIVSAVVLLMLGVRQGEDFWVMMLAAVSLAVAAVPETLQLIVTLSLTQGVKLMVEKNALIRKLAAVETLGNTSVICSDKTGTLTQNRMTIQKLWLPDNEVFAATSDFSEEQINFVKYLTLASSATVEKDADGNEIVVGDATESAILRLLLSKVDNHKKLLRGYPKVGEIPFSSARKMMTTIHKHPKGYLVLTKGAIDRLPFAKTGSKDKKIRLRVHDEFAQEALRVIALGSKVVDSLPENLEELEKGLNFEGLIGLIDPPRPEATQAIATAKKAGIRTVMITGDHAATASAIAKQIGLLSESGVVITGQQLAAMSDEELIQNVQNYAVYARVSPEDKIRIVEAWQENGDVVAMTGDGVNDAPALKAADVGAAMGIAGTEVAKSASDMILTDDNFATIVSAVSQGRNVFINIRKTIYFLLVCNLSEIAIMLGAFLLGWGMPLTPVMLLLINVLGDGIPGLRLAHEESSAQIMNRKPINREESFMGNGLLRVILQQTIAFTVVGLLAYYFGASVNLSKVNAPTHLIGQTMAFLVVAFTSIVHIFTVRSRKSIIKTPIKKNMPLVYSVIAMLVLFSAMAIIPFLQKLFGLTTISQLHWVVVGLLSVVPTIVAEGFKLWHNSQEVWIHRHRLVTHTRKEEV